VRNAKGAGPLELLAHPGQMLTEIRRFDRIGRAALDFEQIEIEAAHQGDQAVVIVRQERPR
jgi:hypothetical protein